MGGQPYIRALNTSLPHPSLCPGAHSLMRLPVGAQGGQGQDPAQRWTSRLTCRPAALGRRMCLLLGVAVTGLFPPPRGPRRKVWKVLGRKPHPQAVAHVYWGVGSILDGEAMKLTPGNTVTNSCVILDKPLPLPEPPFPQLGSTPSLRGSHLWPPGKTGMKTAVCAPLQPAGQWLLVIL